MSDRWGSGCATGKFLPAIEMQRFMQQEIVVLEMGQSEFKVPVIDSGRDVKVEDRLGLITTMVDQKSQPVRAKITKGFLEFHIIQRFTNTTDRGFRQEPFCKSFSV